MEVAKSNKIDEARQWYSSNRPLYEALCNKMQSVISDIINDAQVPVHAISNRAKTMESFCKKIEGEKYDDPIRQITDCCGLRIIAYVENDLEKICNLIKEHFIIDEEKSVDKRETLGTDKVGYRSIHYIVTLPVDRLKMPEFRKYSELSFEIQIRTIIQHAWAEIEHDKNYKFTGVLPQHLKRRFNVLAGVLELADREFNDIAIEIDKYSQNVIDSTSKGELDITIDSTALKSYCKIRFDKLHGNLQYDFYSKDFEETVLKELSDFGIIVLRDLDNIIPENLEDKFLKFIGKTNLAGFLRNLMIVNNVEKYFTTCWQDHWQILDESSVQFYKSYKVPIDKYIAKHQLEVFPDEILN